MSERQMSRSAKLKLNTVTSLINQIVTLICGFILPRYILTCFGSVQNGLVSSIGQFLGLISLCELGVGAVVQSTLYKPLAHEDEGTVSRVMVSANGFFNKIGVIMAIYVAVLLVTYPFIYLDSFGYMSTALLIVAMAITYFAQYFFRILGICYDWLQQCHPCRVRYELFGYRRTAPGCQLGQNAFRCTGVFGNCTVVCTCTGTYDCLDCVRAFFIK